MSTTTVMQLHSASEGKRKVFRYRGIYRYLVTLPTHGPAAVFADREAVRGALDALRESAQRERFDVVAYCFLPDRAVLVVRGRDGGSDMRAFLSLFRARSSELLSARLQGRRLWRKTYLERVLRREEHTVEVARGVFRLPVTSGLSPSPERYDYLGSFTGVHPAPRPRGPSPRGGSGRPSSQKHGPRRGGEKVQRWKRRTPTRGQKPAGGREGRSASPPPEGPAR